MNLMQKYSKNCYNMAKYCNNRNSFDTDIQKNASCPAQLHINQPNYPVCHYHQEDKAERREGFRPPWEAGDLADDFDFLYHWDGIDADGADGVAEKLVLVFATDLLKIHGVGFLIRRLPAVDVDTVVGGLADG